MMNIRNINNESGSYSLEALVSLTAFVLVIMLAYSQIKSMICESIMQQAVSNMAQQVSSYVYVIDRAGFVIQHSDDELSGSDKTINAAGEVVSSAGEVVGDISSITDGNFDQLSDIVGKLFGGDGGDGSIKNMTSSFKAFIDTVKGVDWKKEGVDALKASGDRALKMLGNDIFDEIYKDMLRSYLPSDLDTFQRYFNISDISFEQSALFPNDKNNSIFVAVTYTAHPQFRIGGFGDRKVIKYAYTAAWVKSNTTHSDYADDSE